MTGLCGSSRRGRPARSLVLVLRLRLLGFLFMADIFGLMKDGDDGSEGSAGEAAEGTKGGCIERPFMFRRLGAGDVMGRIKRGTCSETVRVAREGRAPKEVPGKALRGTKLTGESGDEGEGSESDAESVQERVVVGEESADSEARVELLSRWRWLGVTAGGCNKAVGSEANLGLQAESISIILGSTTVTVSWSSESGMLWSRSKTLRMEGIWSSYAPQAVVVYMMGRAGVKRQPSRRVEPLGLSAVVGTGAESECGGLLLAFGEKGCCQEGFEARGGLWWAGQQSD